VTALQRDRPALSGGVDARRGAAIFIASSLVFVASDSLTKSLVANVPVIDVVFGRQISYLLAVILIAGRGDPLRLVRTRRLRTQLARGLGMFGTTATFFWSLSLLPFAEVNTLASSSPLIVIVLAGPLLHERVTRLIAAGAIVGFAGVVTMIGIDPSHLDVAAILPLASACCYAAFTLLTRELRSDAPEVTLFYSGLVGMVASAVLFIAIPTATSPEPGQWLGIFVVGLAALTGHRLLVAAYRWGRASDLAPLGYVQLVWAFLSGAILFHEPVEPRAVLGAIAIAAGGVMTLTGGANDRDPVPAPVDFGDPVELRRDGR
jgi:drug/metabolite transporter (DMT)-like permease